MGGLWTKPNTSTSCCGLKENSNDPCSEHEKNCATRCRCAEIAAASEKARLEHLTQNANGCGTKVKHAKRRKHNKHGNQTIIDTCPVHGDCSFRSLKPAAAENQLSPFVTQKMG